MRDLIFLSLEDWDEVWRRNQFLCAEWLRRFPSMRILFVGRTRDFSHAIRRRQWDAMRKPRLAQVPEFPGLWVLHPTKWFPNSLALGRHWNAGGLCRQVQQASRHLCLRGPLLWINDHCAGHLVGSLGERAVIYDITDDWTQMPSIPPRERALIAHEDEKLCRLADLVLVCSKALEISRAGWARRLERVPNAVDASHYRHCVEALPHAEQIPSGQEKVPRTPVFGYLGTLHGDRLDISLVLELAKRFPEGQVVLCGPDYLRPQERRRLQAMANVELRAAVAYREVPRVLASFDVCIVPHHCTPFTNSLNPLKLWEYFACGKPIASTPVAGFSDFPQWVCLGRGGEGFVEACQRALHEPASAARARVQEAQSQSWTARIEALIEIFRQEGWISQAATQRVLGQRATAFGEQGAPEREQNREISEAQRARLARPVAEKHPFSEAMGVGEVVCHG